MQKENRESLAAWKSECTPLKNRWETPFHLCLVWETWRFSEWKYVNMWEGQWDGIINIHSVLCDQLKIKNTNTHTDINTCICIGQMLWIIMLLEHPSGFSFLADRFSFKYTGKTTGPSLYLTVEMRVSVTFLLLTPNLYWMFIYKKLYFVSSDVLVQGKVLVLSCFTMFIPQWNRKSWAYFIFIYKHFILFSIPILQFDLEQNYNCVALQLANNTRAGSLLEWVVECCSFASTGVQTECPFFMKHTHLSYCNIIISLCSVVTL